jgi:Lrp/AsnC family transcriptional regulator, leucine-responsive regulatory protein
MKGEGAMRLHIAKALLDERNIKLLRLMRDDPQITTSELARRIGMSAPAVRERIERLKDSGVILGYRLEIDPAALGYPVAIFIRVRPMPGQLSKIATLAKRLPQIVECHRITGEDCYIMRAHVEALDQLDALLDRFLVYGQTTTSLIQSSPVPQRSLPLPGEGNA